MAVIGKIGEIWRYPVKSTRGEQLPSAAVGAKGLAGDRGWAIRDETVGEVRGGRHLPKLLQCRSRYAQPPVEEPYPPAIITLPDGAEASSDDPRAAELLSAWLGRPVTVWPLRPATDTEHYRRLPMSREELVELFGRVPGEPVPDLSIFPPVIKDYIAEPGTYFDVMPVHLLTTATLAFLERRNPGAAWKVQRFRPNVVVDSGDLEGLIDAGWGGKTIRLGEVELHCFSPAVRCAITTHAQGADLPKDPSVLRTIVRDADQNVGVYCSVRGAGTIRVGDPVAVEG